MSRYPKLLRPLLPILAAFVVLVSLHSLATPVFEAPDEVWHYAYVRWLAEGQGLPSMLDNTSGANQEVAQPPLYYSVAALLSGAVDDTDLHDLSWHNPGFGYQAPGTTLDNKNMLIHTERERWPWHGAVLAIHTARMTSLIFGVLTVIASWGLGYEAFQSKKAALITASLVAFHPQFIFISSVINNDPAAAALSTATLWSTAHIMRQGITPKRAALTGGLAGLAILCKTSALALLPLIGLALLWANWKSGFSIRRLTIEMGTYSLAILALGSWWYIRNIVLYGDPLGLTNHLDTLWGRPEPIAIWALWPEIPTLLKSFWAAYGWGHIYWSNWVYILLIGWSTLLLAYGIYNQIISKHATKDQAALYNNPQIAILSLSLLWLSLIFAALLRWMQQVEAPHGRLLFPAIGAWALAITAGILALQNRHWTVRHGLPLSMAIIAALAPGMRILPAFTPPKLYLEPVILQRTMITPVGLTYDSKAELLGVHILQRRILPGEYLEVRACWKALKLMETDYTVFLQLLGPENQIAAMRHTYPGLGNFPTSLWPADKAFCDTYQVPVAPWAEAPLQYNLEIGLFNAETGGRLSATRQDGMPAAPPIAAQVIVAPAEGDQTVVQPQATVEANFGEAITLRGYDITPITTAGETLSVTLHWEAQGAVNDDLVAFIHLWEPGAPYPLAQHDDQPHQGWFPTTVWKRGDQIRDEHPLEIPANLSPGHYPLWAGLYRAADTERIPAYGPDGRYPHDLIPLGAIEVR